MEASLNQKSTLYTSTHNGTEYALVSKKEEGRHNEKNNWSKKYQNLADQTPTPVVPHLMSKDLDDSALPVSMPLSLVGFAPLFQLFLTHTLLL